MIRFDNVKVDPEYMLQLENFKMESNHHKLLMLEKLKQENEQETVRADNIEFDYHKRLIKSHDLQKVRHNMEQSKSMWRENSEHPGLLHLDTVQRFNMIHEEAHKLLRFDGIDHSKVLQMNMHEEISKRSLDQMDTDCDTSPALDLSLKKRHSSVDCEQTLDLNSPESRPEAEAGGRTYKKNLLKRYCKFDVYQ